MKTFVKLMLVDAMLVLLSGCALLHSEIDKVANTAGDLVKYYCENIPDESVRAQFREKVNAAAAPNSVTVACNNGKPPLFTDAPQ